jgi:hypothetical protein
MQAQIIEYIVVKAGRAERLAEKVNELIREGWQPQGGLDFEKNFGLRQAMVKVKRHPGGKTA